jgi:UDP-N-acetyl-D-glucosamine/UDP-N-acetyl-D-galactosamine dehydrogenase
MMYNDLVSKKKKIAVIGLGYVGLPIALEFAKNFSVIGFDINEKRVNMMRNKIDPSNELESDAFDNKDILFSCNLEDLKETQFFIIAVPTDINENKVPNLTPLLKASQTVGKVLKKGDYVVYESTVYPGCTEDDCLPELEKESGLKRDIDFQYGYSPERIVPGDKVKTLTNILKIVSGNNTESLEEISKVYGHIIIPGVYKASSIKVAEAAKVIENTQRDLNISLMNELAMIFDRVGIDTREVIEAAGTKWNFVKLFPGLVGGHCIGVDPYYLIHKSRQLGYDPQVIASGRRVNDGMPAWIAKKLVQKLIAKGKNPSACKVLMLGITFKEDVSDIRNSKVVDLVKEIQGYSMQTTIVDPQASAEEIKHEYNIHLSDSIDNNYDAIVVSVAHKEYINLDEKYFKSILSENGIIMDIKGLYSYDMNGIDYWRL